MRFRCGLQTGRYDEFLGLERERKLDLRLDDQEARTVHHPGRSARGRARARRRDEDPDAHLKLRVPVKAGTRTLVATFLKDTVMPEGILPNTARRPSSKASAAFRSPARTMCKGRATTPSRERIFLCHPAAPAEEEACAEKILAEPRAPRLPAADHRGRPAATARALPARRRRTAASRPACRLALQKILVSPEFIFRMEFDPPDAAPGQRPPDQRRRACLAPVLLPVEQHSRRRAARGRRARRAQRRRRSWRRQVRRMLADPRSQALVKNFAGQWLFLRNIARIQPDPAVVPELRREPAAGAGAGNRAPDRKHAARGSQRRRSAQHGLHLRQSAPGRALRHPGHLRQRVPPRRGQRPEPAGPARTGQHPGGDLLSQPDGADDPRQVGAGAAPGHAAAAAAAQCSVVEGRCERTRR